MEHAPTLEPAAPDHHPADPPAEGEEILAARLTRPADSLPADPLAQVEAPAFPVVLRGYDRAAVEAYVERVARLVGELFASRSPREAVRQALERVGAETAEILRQAHDAADELTSEAVAEAEALRTRTVAEAEALRERVRAETAELEARTRVEADERVAEAERIAAATLAASERRLAELDREIDAIWQERQRLIDDVRRVSGGLERLAGEAEARYPAEDSASATVEIPAAELPDAEA